MSATLAADAAPAYRVTAHATAALSLGHCITSNEPWLVKSVIGFRF